MLPLLTLKRSFFCVCASCACEAIYIDSFFSPSLSFILSVRHEDIFSIQAARICNHKASYIASRIIAMTHERIGFFSFFLSRLASDWVVELFVHSFTLIVRFSKEREKTGYNSQPALQASQFYYYALAAPMKRMIYYTWILHYSSKFLIQERGREREFNWIENSFRSQVKATEIWTMCVSVCIAVQI